MKNTKTIAYYKINGISYYKEFEYYIPQDFNCFQVSDKSVPGNLYNLLFETNESIMCRDDGPAVVYFNGTTHWKSSKCKKHTNDYNNLYNWNQNTNHILCSICNKYCKQCCFIG